METRGRMRGWMQKFRAHGRIDPPRPSSPKVGSHTETRGAVSSVLSGSGPGSPTAQTAHYTELYRQTACGARRRPPGRLP